MKDKSIKELLLEYLEGVRGWVAGGVLEDYIRSKEGNKASNTSRRLRELYNEGRIDRKLTQIDGKGVWFVWYKIKLTNKLF